MPVNVEIPALGDSVSEAVLIKWHKNDGDIVAEGEGVCELETDKANVDVPAPIAGVIKLTRETGATVHIGETIARIDESPAAIKAAGNGKAVVTASAKAPVPEKPVMVIAPGDRAQDLSPAVRRIVEEENINPANVAPTGPGGRITKEDAIRLVDSRVADKTSTVASPTSAIITKAPAIESPNAPTNPVPLPASGDTSIRRVPMTKIRKKIAERLVTAQHTAAILTTFNEVDLQNVMDIRTKYKEKFEKIYGVGLGFMSFFSKAACLALKEFPAVNAELDGDDVVYHDYVNLGIAVSTERGLAVPVLRRADLLSFAKIESEIKRLATATKDGKLSVEEMSGGTFTITNGGVFGSLLSTPIINMPQAAILGMHTIQKRPVVINDKIEIRPMMYIALSYDHRLIDGKQSVSFLVRIKELLEDPSRLLLEM